MKKSKRVALIIRSASRTYGGGLIRGVMKYSRLHGPWVFPLVFYGQDLFYVARGNEQAQLEYLKKWGPQGVIVSDAKDVEGWGIPVFVVKGTKPSSAKLNYIVTDNRAISRMAAEHLLERGFRNFGYCGFYDNTNWSDIDWSVEREKYFSERISEAGFKISIYKQPKSRANRSWNEEEAALVEWLRGLPKPVGIMACNDDRGQHVTETCAYAGLDVPCDVAVIGADNDERVCEMSNPPLSSVALDTEKAGFRASELLDKMMEGRKAKPQTVIVQPSRVVTRQSTNIVAVEDKLVSRALMFIHHNAKRLIQVADVIDYLGVSRRNLDDKFMKMLGRSVHDEIKRVRIDLICHMLLETELSISDIVLGLGYNDTNHIARYFKQKMGMSPLEYRKLHGHK